MRKKILIVLGVVLIFVLLVVGIFGIQIYRYLRETEKSDRAHYTWVAHMSYFAEYIEENGFGEFGNGTHEFLETRKFKSVEEMYANLPAGFSDAIKDALTSGVSQNGFDLKNKQVTIYEINPELLPLEEEGSDTETDCHYCVMEYPDNTYRFVLIIAIQYTR